MAINTAAGRILMTEAGKVLYVSNNKAGIIKASACKGDCATEWRPLGAPAIAADPPKGWSIVTAPDGSHQWAFQGKGVYTYDGDARYADLNGLEVPGWQAATLQKRLTPPSDLTIQVTSEGEVIADKAGMTTYGWGCGDETPDRALCDIPGATQTYRLSICGSPETCIRTWKPVIASPGSKPVGRTWTIVDVDATGANQYATPGQKNVLHVWAYRGRPIYTFAGDKEPGDINGHNVTSGFIWGYGMVRADGDGRGLF
jgi:predicted lipoprotein with Yx(FWY)xxD motif